jgi:hypothetical protein
MYEATRERMHNRLLLSSLPDSMRVYHRHPALKRWAIIDARKLFQGLSRQDRNTALEKAIPHSKSYVALYEAPLVIAMSGVPIRKGDDPLRRRQASATKVNISCYRHR